MANDQEGRGSVSETLLAIIGGAFRLASLWIASWWRWAGQRTTTRGKVLAYGGPVVGVIVLLTIIGSSASGAGNKTPTPTATPTNTPTPTGTPMSTPTRTSTARPIATPTPCRTEGCPTRLPAPTAAPKPTSIPKPPTPAPPGYDSPEEVAYELATINGDCFAHDAAAALGSGAEGCDSAVEFLGIIRRLADKCTETSRHLADELVTAHNIVHDHGYPHVSLLQIAHDLETAVADVNFAQPCADVLALFITTAYP